MDFKKAEMVELHNSNVVIHRDNYSDAVIGWTEFPGENEEFYVKGDTLATFLKMVGVELSPFREERHSTHMEHMDFPITRRKVTVGSRHGEYVQHKIVDLYVKIEKSDLIHIRFVSQWEDEGKLVNYTQEVVYSGSYTVWWPYDEKNEQKVPA